MKIYFVDGQPVLWAGSEASFDAAIQAQARFLLSEHAQKFETRAETYDGSDGLPPMISKRGDVGILHIEGSLINGTASWLRYFGMVGYDDIVAAAARLYADPDVKRVMVRIESPGGMVDGIMDAGENLAKISATKPSMVYTGSMAASGGYWLATSVKGPITVGPTAQVGSIGVVSVHTDLSAAYEAQGIKKTVLRSGDNKARMNSIEPLTPELKAAEEAKMADVHGIFRAQVARGRPALSTEDLLEVTDGKTFLGKRAKSAGLADNVATFEQALKLLDSHNPSGNTSAKSKGASMKLSEQQIAMLVSGVPVDQLGLSVEDLAACQAEIDALVNANKPGDAGAEGTDKKPAVAEGGAAGANAPPADGVGIVSADLTAALAKVDLLNSQLTEVNAQLGAKTAEVAALTAAQAPMQTNLDALTTIAKLSVGRLQIALQSPNTSESMDVAALVAAHTSLQETFVSKFKIGGVSKTTAPAEKTAGVPYGFGLMTANANPTRK